MIKGEVILKHIPEIEGSSQCDRSCVHFNQSTADDGDRLKLKGGLRIQMIEPSQINRRESSMAE